MQNKIQRLNERVLQRQEERERLKNRERIFSLREDLIKTATDRLAGVGFFCEECGKDFTAVGRKVVMGDYAWYYAKCLCGARCIRRITDKSSDPYYFKSKITRRQQVVNSTDMLTPDDPLFRLVYPKQWEKMEKQKYESGK